MRSPAIEPGASESTGSVFTPDAVAAELLTKVTDFAMQSLGQHTLRRNIHNYNGAMLSYNHQADMANKLGLSDEQKRVITPFPDARPTTVNMNVNSPQVATEKESPVEIEPDDNKPQLWSKVWPWLLAGATGMTGVGATSLLQPKQGPPAPPPVADEDIPAEIGLEVE